MKHGAYSDQRDLRPPREKSRTPKKSSRPEKHDRPSRRPKEKSKDDNRNEPRNISSEYRSPKKDTVVRPSTNQYSDDGESVESFGEFRSPKAQVNPRR